MAEPTEEQQIPQETEEDEEAKERELWWEHAPLLYDVIISKALIWPSLTVQFLPKILFDCRLFALPCFFMNSTRFYP